MTDTISKAAKAKAKELASHEVTRRGGLALRAPDWEQALARVLQEHSDKAKLGLEHITQRGPDRISEVLPALQSMILPDDEPDPLVEALNGIVPHLPTPADGESYATATARELRQALDAAGYEIRRKDG